MGFFRAIVDRISIILAESLTRLKSNPIESKKSISLNTKRLSNKLSESDSSESLLNSLFCLFFFELAGLFGIYSRRSRSASLLEMKVVRSVDVILVILHFS